MSGCPDPGLGDVKTLYCLICNTEVYFIVSYPPWVINSSYVGHGEVNLEIIIKGKEWLKEGPSRQRTGKECI